VNRDWVEPAASPAMSAMSRKLKQFKSNGRRVNSSMVAFALIDVTTTLWDHVFRTMLH
jgi:hypothetical protein